MSSSAGWVTLESGDDDHCRVHVRRREVLQTVVEVGQPLRLEKVVEGTQLRPVVGPAGYLRRAGLGQLAVGGGPVSQAAEARPDPLRFLCLVGRFVGPWHFAQLDLAALLD